MNVCIMASGGGTNAENIMNHAKSLSGLNVVGLITDQSEAYALKRAKIHDVPHVCIPLIRNKSNTRAEDKAAHEAAIYEWMNSKKVDWVFLAGYMRILSADFIKKFHDPNLGVSRILNIHPSLLPSFPGKNAYEQAFQAGVKSSGVTVHFVDPGVDTGPPIMQESFPRFEQDTLEDFEKRGLEVEYRLYRKAMDMVSKGRLSEYL